MWLGDKISTDAKELVPYERVEVMSAEEGLKKGSGDTGDGSGQDATLNQVHADPV